MSDLILIIFTSLPGCLVCHFENIHMELGMSWILNFKFLTLFSFFSVIPSSCVLLIKLIDSITGFLAIISFIQNTDVVKYSFVEEIV